MTAPARKEEGAVLLTTLLLVSLMASLAVAIMDTARVSARRTLVTDASAQARHYLDGAETYAVSYLSAVLKDTPSEAFNLLLLEGQEVTLPIDGGTITLNVRDGTNCFSPSDALGGGAERLLRLMQYRGVPSNDAIPLVARIKDWQDEDQGLTPGGAEDGSYLGLAKPYRTAGSPMTSISELRAVEGLTREIYGEIAPYMCIREADGPINVNTLRPEDAPILAAQMGTDPGEALGLINSRPVEGWSDLTPFGVGEADSTGTVPQIDPEIEPAQEDAATNPGTANSDDGQPQFVLEPQLLDVSIRVDYREITRFAAAQLDVTGPPTVLRRRRGEAAIQLERPRPDSLGNFGDTDGSP